MSIAETRMNGKSETLKAESLTELVAQIPSKTAAAESTVVGAVEGISAQQP